MVRVEDPKGTGLQHVREITNVVPVLHPFHTHRQPTTKAYSDHFIHTEVDDNKKPNLAYA